MDITQYSNRKPEVKASEKYSAGVRQANKNNWSAVSASRPEGGREASEKKKPKGGDLENVPELKCLIFRSAVSR